MGEGVLLIRRVHVREESKLQERRGHARESGSTNHRTSWMEDLFIHSRFAEPAPHPFTRSAPAVAAPFGATPGTRDPGPESFPVRCGLRRVPQEATAKPSRGLCRCS